MTNFLFNLALKINNMNNRALKFHFYKKLEFVSRKLGIEPFFSLCFKNVCHIKGSIMTILSFSFVQAACIEVHDVWSTGLPCTPVLINTVCVWR